MLAEGDVSAGERDRDRSADHGGDPARVRRLCDACAPRRAVRAPRCAPRAPPGSRAGWAAAPTRQPWWLGYLDTGASDIVFWDSSKVMLYTRLAVCTDRGRGRAGPRRGLRLRESTELPDLMFPEDHAWLVSTLWDDDWSCIGGSEVLIADLLQDLVLGPQARQISLGEDATPAGHAAQ